ncbi:hypothetical protein GCM10028807_36050 [Spirosoma daeguense]
MNKAIFTIILSLLFAHLQAQNAPSKNAPIEKRQYHTQRITGQPIKLDGIPNESAWDAVEWSGSFTQYQPNEGKAPSQPTLFKILYDDKFLYVGYRCLDAAPDSVIKRMSRRDEFPGDWVEINIDSYHDQRTAFSFSMSVSGVRGDEFISQNGNNWDTSWNPIWYGKTHVDSTGWTAEVKIPLSQLRYGNEPSKVWGIQVTRRLFRKEERSVWQYIPQNSGVWVSGFGELHGLTNVPSQKQIEIAPYVVAKTEKYAPVEGNPFATGTDSKVTVGLDGKVAVTSDLILDFTVNPDFGQVEADPSRVRIDGFQNFFEERRPFFIESRNIFDYQVTGSEAGGDYDSDLLFYSRRIGGSPHGYPSLGQREYAQVPQNAPILGAAKFSGKTKKGWSIGILESITGRTMAEIDRAGDRRQEAVEPLTSYFVGRLQKDIDAGNTVIGGIFTSVNRENNLNHQLHTNAFSGGLDFLHFWKNRTWYFRGNLIFSQVQGSKEVITNTQRAFEHLFQRSNAPEIQVDENRTSLTGTGGTFRLGKTGGKSGKLGQVFKFETGITFRSPELELNDIGFMLTSNEINHFSWAGLQYQKSFSIFRSARINYNHWSRWDFGGQFLYQAFNSNAHATFRNNWQVGMGSTWNPYEVSNNALRGGSSLRLPSGINHWGYIQSDFRKKVLGSVEFANSWGFERTVHNNDVTVTLRVQPLDALNVSLSAGYSHNWRRQDQFVGSATYNGALRTIVSEVNQNTFRYTLRLNYNITPDLTLQYYGQPFITRPTYQHFAYVADPLNKDFDSRFRPFTGNELRYENGRYVVDENRDGTVDYSFSKPDFNFVQFRSNLVARWEYKPGSELYLVWSQGSTPDVANDLSSPLNRSLFDTIFAQQARNIFLVKMTYRFLK